MDITSWDSATWQAWGVWATVVVYLGILLFAWRQVREAREMREAELRPFVVVDFDTTSRPPMIYLTISNLGRTLARNVRFRFTPSLSSSFEDDRHSLSKIQAPD